ncbi:MAG: amidase [Deltaproteobacteria bacterium]|nr:amidase [Deltaproteobacteria bacterium]
MTEPRELGLVEMVELMGKGELTSSQIVQSCLEGLDAYNDHLKTFISIDREEVLKQSRAADSLAAKDRGPLTGIPVAIKDLIDVAGDVTTQGSSFFRDAEPAKKDAPIIGRLREQGAIIFGKTNLHEFAWGGTSANPHFGICRNPWNLDHNPGGSSGGSGAAVAARLVPGALGTDTLGSIRIPSSACGITGLKPTYGLLPTKGIFPLGYTLDHVGPMARSVADVRLMFAPMLSVDARTRLKKTGQGVTFSTSGSKRLKGVRIARLPDLVPESLCHETTFQQYQLAYDLAEDEGAEIVDEQIPGFESAITAAFTLTLAQASEIHHERLSKNPDGFGDDVRALLEQGHMVTAVDYIRAQRVRAKLLAEAQKLINWVDAWIFPTTPYPALRVGKTGEVNGALFTGPVNLLGFPSIALPSGLTKDNLPVSIQIIGAPHREFQLLGIAEILEERLDFPKDLPVAMKAL